jgi:PAS domain S-box-containing protein
MAGIFGREENYMTLPVRSLMLCISFMLALTAPLLYAAKAEEPSDHGSTLQEILILNSYHHGYAWSDDEQAGIIDVFRAKDKNWLPVIEYLDLKRLPDGRHLVELKQLFRRKYQNNKFSVVIAMDNPALEFAIDNKAELFGNAPIVFCGINNYTPSLLKGRSDVTGIIEAIDPAGTIEVMLRLHPATQEILSPHDYTATGLAVRKELEALVPRFGAKVRFRFTDPMTMEELLKELERLPKDSLVLEIGFITDKSGRTFGISETTKLFSEHSPVPIYSTYEQRLGSGIVGGKLLSPRVHGADAARIAMRVLAGEKASAIPVVFESDSQFMFDYKIMSRFGIPLSALPEGGTVINKPVSFYVAHRGVIQTALSVIVFLAVVIFLLAINIIQRRRSSEVIRRSEELLKTITSSTPDHILVQDINLRYSFVINPQLGLMVQDMIGKTDHDFLSKEDADKLTKIKKQVLDTGRPVHVEVPLLSLNGEQQFFGGTYVPKLNAQGQVDGLIGYFRNITERMRAEEEKERLQGQLQQAMKMEAVGRLAGGVAHDFNNLLTVINGYSELLIQRLGENSPLRKDAEEILQAGNRAESLTRQLLLFSRKQVLQPKVIDLNMVVSKAGKMLQRLIGENIELRTILGEGLGRVKADEGQVEQILINLAINARDAMPGGGELTIETANVVLDEIFAKDHPSLVPGPHVLLLVRDTGSGIPDEIRRHIFEPFFTTKERGKGTGLGLATVYGIVQQSQGHLDFHSESGKGTIFKIYLPCVDGESKALSTVTTEAPKGSEAVLVVEDENSVREIVNRVLSGKGYRVLMASDGSEGLRISGEYNGPIDLLLTDLVMPKMGGRELATRLEAERAGMKVLFMSGYTEDAISHQGVLEAGLSFIQKPFTTVALLRKVREVLDGK